MTQRAGWRWATASSASVPTARGCRHSPATACRTGAGTVSRCRTAGHPSSCHQPAPSSRDAILGAITFRPRQRLSAPWMFDNPHIMNLGRLRLVRGEHRHLLPEEIKGLERTLDLWTGLQTSRYQIDGQDVTVETCVHPSLDLVAVRIESALVTEDGLQAALDFGYPSLTNNPWVGEFARYHVGHTTEAQRASGRRLDLRRDVDAMAYHVAMEAAPGCDVLEPDLPPGFRRLAIVRADYGTGDRRTDVTARLAAAVNDNRLTLAVTDASLGAVATPGTPKSLRVAYTVDGVSPDGIRAEQTVEIPENRVLRLPPHQGAYRISTRGGARSASSVRSLPNPCRRSFRTSRQRELPAPLAGSPFGNRVGLSTCPPAGTLAGRSWNGELSSPNTSWQRNRRAVGARLKWDCLASIPGTASFTWRCSGGILRTMPCGTVGRWLIGLSAATTDLRLWHGSSRPNSITKG